MSSKTSRIMGYPFGGGVKLRLAITDQYGNDIVPDDDKSLMIIIEIKTPRATRYDGKLQICSIGIPTWFPIQSFCIDNGTARPTGDLDVNPSWGLPYGLVPWVSYYPTQYHHLVDDDLYALVNDAMDAGGLFDVPGHQYGWDYIFMNKYKVVYNRWKNSVAAIDAQIELTATEITGLFDQIQQTSDPRIIADLLNSMESKEAEIKQLRASKDEYFHGLRTISVDNVAKKAQYVPGRSVDGVYRKGEYVLTFNKKILKDDFFIENIDDLEFFVIALEKQVHPEFGTRYGYFHYGTMDYYHPGTHYPPDPQYGAVGPSETGIGKGSYAFRMEPPYQNLWMSNYYGSYGD